MNIFDSVIAYFSPEKGVRRKAARTVLAQYDAAEPSRLRRFYRDTASSNEMVQRAATAIRVQARSLGRNHDIARGALRTLVNNIVGPKGIGIEPQPRNADGSINTEYAGLLREAWRDWIRRPEVTHTLSFARLQRAAVRAWIRDGEVFAQMLVGPRNDLDHGTRVPFSLEMFEADLVPMDYTASEKRIVQGIERNAWGRPTALHVIKVDNTQLGGPLSYSGNTKRIPWEYVLHIANIDNIGQVRGVSEFASVITRLEDIKDYEESERVAAKIAAMLTAYVKKGTSDAYDPSADGSAREINFAPGMVIDDLAVGEEIGMIDSKRPNTNLVGFRQGQLRAIAAGMGVSYSSIARDYNGSYSSQRQELVEQWIHYATLTDDFVGAFVQPVWEQFVAIANLSGAVRAPSSIASGTEDDALFTAQAMPWIDPLKEAQGATELVRSGFSSEIEVIRKRGGNPQEVLEQLAAFRKEAEEKGVLLGAAPTPPPPPDPGAGQAREQTSALATNVTAFIAAQAASINREPPAPAPVNVHAHIQPPAVTVTNDVATPVVNVAAPEVTVTNEIPAPIVNVAAPEVTIEPMEVTIEAPVVNVTNEVQPADVTVALPSRKTESSIKRDERGNIINVTQIEESI